MQLQGEAIRITIYISESDRYHGKNLYSAILEFLRREGASGATVTRSLAGFGAHSRIHTGNIEVLSSDLPIRIEWIDLPECVERLLPGLMRMIDDGLVLRENITVLHYSVGRSHDPLSQPVIHIMRTEVAAALTTTPVHEVVRLLLERGVRSLPIVDNSHRLVGIITDGDLLNRAGLSARLALHTELSNEQMRAQLAQLDQSGLTAADIMTTPVVSVQREESLRAVATKMVQRDLKRLPVVDSDGCLVGMVSRIDVFRAAELHRPVSSIEDEPPRTGRTISELMHSDTPTVGPAASLEEIVQALEASRRRRVVVVDADGRVLGIITDGDLLRRSQQKQHPGLWQRLRGLIAGGPTVDQVLPDAGERAADLMSAPAITVQPATPLSAALHLMTEHAIKRLPVVDDEGKLLGLLGRASVLRGLLEGP